MSLLAALAFASPAAPAGPPPLSRADEARIEALIGRMTPEEKFGQLQQLGGDPKSGRLLDGQLELVRRGGIGSFLDVRGAAIANAAQRVAVEGSPSKIPILFGFDVVHGYRTIFPVPLAQASTWDPVAVERAAGTAAAEASAAGVRWSFAPMVDIARDPRWGRIVEGAGEDPYLGAAMARAQVRGLQGKDIGAPDRVVACAKHWAAYGAAEGGREYNAADVSERALRTVYFPPFRAALDAGVGTFMTALNTVNGVPATAHPFTLGAVLRGEWKFDGPVIADYNAVKQLVAHGLAADESEAARLALLAGVDIEEESRTFATHGPRLLKEGRVSMARLNEAVRRVLRLKMRLGLFDRPYTDEARERAILGAPEHLAAARALAGRSLVLLKNDGGLLPLRRDLRSIAVLGPLADDREAPLGHWRGDGKTEDVIAPLAGIRAKVAERGGAVRVDHARGCSADGDDAGGIAEAVELARRSDLAIVFVGETAAMSGEASSRASLELSGRQKELVRKVHETGTPTVVALINGRPLAIGWAAEHVPAILEAWFGGTQGGHAIADALFGDINPGGKLPVTFPRSVGQVPIYYNHLNTGRPASDDRYTSKYIDAPVAPLFPFGHGLSYTRFQLSDLRLSSRGIPADGQLEVSVVVENIGDRAGDEVVQLYVRDIAASVPRPVKELRGFQRTALAPGAKQTVHFTLGPRELGFYDQRMRFVVEPGEFQVIVGTSSAGGAEAGFQVFERAER